MKHDGEKNPNKKMSGISFNIGTDWELTTYPHPSIMN